MSWFRRLTNDTANSLQGILESYKVAFRRELIKQFQEIAEQEAERIASELSMRMYLHKEPTSDGDVYTLRIRFKPDSKETP